ncbi:MAG: hypothetical protein IPK15_02040 [Verrucomicrobia bacterium]|nr:hypothetical protein [Verrucomicrobiota bacterium]
MKSTRRPNSSWLAIALCHLVLVAAVSAAQPAPDQFFHQGAQHFLATNQLSQAKLAVTNGLKLFPNDEKLKKLWELLNQQQTAAEQGRSKAGSGQEGSGIQRSTIQGSAETGRR